MDLVNYFMNLYKGRKQVILLSWAYLALAAVTVLIAGICALVNQSVGVAMLILPLVAIIALCMNVVAWSFVRFIIDVITIRVKEKEAQEKAVKKEQKKLAKNKLN